MKLENFIDYAKVIEKYLQLLKALNYEIVVCTSDYDEDFYEVSLENENSSLGTLGSCYKEKITCEELEKNILEVYKNHQKDILKQINQKQKEIKNLKKILNTLDNVS